LRYTASSAKVAPFSFAMAPSHRANPAPPFIHLPGEQHAKEHDFPVGWVSGGGAYQISLSRLF